MANTYKVIQDKQVWEKFVLSHDPKSFLQSWNWGETHQKSGDKVHRIGFYNDEVLLGVALFIKQDARRGPHLLVPGGPIIDWQDKSMIDCFMKALKDVAINEKVWFVRIRPELLDTSENNEILSHLGFISAPMHLHAENTWVLDVKKTEEQLLYGMRKNTRYSVRKSLEEDYELVTLNNNEGLDILDRLQDETVKRHKFLGFSKDLFQNEIETFGKDGQLNLYVCRKASKPFVSAMIIFYGDYAYYHHSGSTNEATHSYASYFMQWSIIKEAKKRGIKYYNFWGIAPSTAKNHRFMGVTIFKKGFGGEAVDWVHARDYVVSNLYWGTWAFENLRKRARGL